MLVIAFEHKWILFKNLCYGLMLSRYMKRYEPKNLSVHCCCMFVEEVWLCISFKDVFLDGCYLIGVIVSNTVEARVLFTLRHGCASLLCEARGLSK